MALLVEPAQASFDTHYEPNPKVTAKLPPKADPASIQVLDRTSRRAQVSLGRWAIRGSAGTSKDELVAATRAKAAELGADFVVVSDKVDSTRRESGPRGATGGSGMQSRNSPTILSSAPALYATFGVYAKGTLGIEYMDLGVTWGRYVVNTFREGSKAPAAGVQPGDQVVEVDGIPYDDPRYADWILRNAPGQIARLLLKRGESNVVVEVTLIPNE